MDAAHQGMAKPQAAKLMDVFTWGLGNCSPGDTKSSPIESALQVVGKRQGFLKAETIGLPHFFLNELCLVLVSLS